MEVIELLANDPIPSVIYCTGKKYSKTKEFPLNYITLLLDVDLLKLQSKLCNLEVSFEVRLRGKKINMDILTKDGEFSVPINTEVERILWSYNRQVLMRYNDEFIPYQQRFNYEISFKRRG